MSLAMSFVDLWTLGAWCLAAKGIVPESVKEEFLGTLDRAKLPSLRLLGRSFAFVLQQLRLAAERRIGSLDGRLIAIPAFTQDAYVRCRFLGRDARNFTLATLREDLGLPRRQQAVGWQEGQANVEKTQGEMPDDCLQALDEANQDEDVAVAVAWLRRGAWQYSRYHACRYGTVLPDSVVMLEFHVFDVVGVLDFQENQYTDHEQSPSEEDRSEGSTSASEPCGLPPWVEDP